MQTDLIHTSEPSVLARWLIPALLLSLLLHLGFVGWSMRYHFQHFGIPAVEEPVRRFMVASVDLETVPPPPPVAIPTPKPITPATVPVSDETVPSAEQPTLATSPKPLPKIDTNQLEGSGKANPLLDNPAEIKQATAPEFLNDPAALTETLLSQQPETPRHQPDLNAPSIGQPGQGTTEVPGFSSLDTLLAETGPLSSKTAPIFIPSDLLYDYDSATLGELAIDSLKKLGTLIQRNPQAKFTIEGYTDSFGTAEYNQRLSQARAESVKMWLVEVFGISADRIRTKGMGASKLLTPASGDIEAQRPNRRVEIVIQED